jgi:hypothetical protein
MTVDKLCEIVFSEQLADDFGKFKDLPKKLKVSRRPDLCGLVLLDKLVPGSTNLISSANHEEVVLSVPLWKLAARAKEEDVRNLARCGISLSAYAPDLIVII